MNSASLCTSVAREACRAEAAAARTRELFSSQAGEEPPPEVRPEAAAGAAAQAAGADGRKSAVEICREILIKKCICLKPQRENYYVAHKNNHPVNSYF